MLRPFTAFPARYLKAVGLLPLNRYGVIRHAAVIGAIAPLVVFGWLAQHTGRWEMFERSGSFTSAVGLLLASRRYVRYGVFELATLHVGDELRSDAAEVLEDVITSKLGLGVSAFGSIVWGWGTYLGWWCFAFALVWPILAVRDARRDSRTGAISALTK